MPAPNDLRKNRGRSRSLTASGAVLNPGARLTKLPSGKKMKSGTPAGSTPDQAWQEELWYYFDTIGEFEFVANWTGNLMSKAKLFATKDGKAIKDQNHPANVAMNEFFKSKSGQSAAMKKLGIHYTVTGDALIVSWVDQTTKVEHWEVISPIVFKQNPGGKYTISGKEINDPHPMVIRTWRKHPRDPERVHSPAKASIPVLSEIDGLTKHVAAQIDSRLTSSGMLVLPNEISFSSSAQMDDAQEEQANLSETDKFVRELIAVASEAIADRSSASAKVPIVLTADGEHLDKIKWIEFWSSLDKTAQPLRSEAIRRLALGMDIPPEALLGSGDANHWSMWSVDESSIKSHIEPNLLELCADLSDAYLRPAILGESDGGKVIIEADLGAYEIGVDTAEMRLRPNRSKEALELYALGAINVETLRRETGFDGESAMNNPEYRRWLLQNVARGSSTPEMMARALEILGAALDMPIVDPTGSGGREEQTPPVGESSRPELTDPEILDKDRQRKVDEKAASNDKDVLYAAAEQMVFRALERAGNRMKNIFKLEQPGVDVAELYLFRQCTGIEAEDLLKDAFSQIERFAPQYGIAAEDLKFTLDRYCRSIICSQRPHTRDGLTTALESLELAHV